MTDVRAARARADSSLDVDVVQEVLSSQFDVVLGTPRVVRRSRLDTFDGRLAKAGRRLHHVTETSDERLELVGDGETFLVPLGPEKPRWPAMAASLPPGPVRDEVARLAGIRALIVHDEGRRLVRQAELRNSDRKIVVRLVVDEPADDASREPPTVLVKPLRGYEKEAARAWDLVTSVLEPVAEQVSDQPSAAGAAAPVDPASPGRVLLATELLDFLAAIRANLPGTVDDVDTEFLHDLRVAVRRTRSVLKLGREVLPDEWRTRWQPEFTWLGDLTTPVRDLDVHQLALPQMAGWLVAARPEDLWAFERHLSRRRTAERRLLLRGLRSKRLRALLDDWEAAVRAVLAGEGEAGPSAGRLAAAHLSRAHRRVVRAGSRIGSQSPAQELHGLRKRGKELRYALEVFAPVLDPDDAARAVRDLKELQDVLGRFQDSEVQRATLRTFAAEMVADGVEVAPVLAMGELVAHLDHEQQAARAEFDRVFARYVRPANARRMARLYAGGDG
jgi:CHAD domain-containing protein